IPDEGSAGELVQDLRPRGPHAGPQPGGKHHGGERPRGLLGARGRHAELGFAARRKDVFLQSRRASRTISPGVTHARRWTAVAVSIIATGLAGCNPLARLRPVSVNVP